MELIELLQLRYYASQLTSSQGSELRAYYDTMVNNKIIEMMPEIMKVTWIEKKCNCKIDKNGKIEDCPNIGYVKKEKQEFTCESCLKEINK